MKKIFSLIFIFFTSTLLFAILDLKADNFSFNELSSYQIHALDIAVKDNYAYIASESQGIVILNISDINNISEISKESSDWAVRAKISENYLFIAEGYNGFRIDDISNPSSPTVVSSIEVESGVSNFAIENNYVYATGYGKFNIIDISDKSHPTITGTYNLNEWSFGVSVKDNYAFVSLSDSEKILILDISDKTNPKKIKEISDIYSNDIKVENNYLYIVNSGLTVYDVTSPSSPQLIKNFQFGTKISTSDKLFIYNDNIFIAKSSGIYILDKDFNLKGSKEDIEANGIYVNNNYIFVTTTSSLNLEEQKFIIYSNSLEENNQDNDTSNIIEKTLFRAGSEANDGIISGSENLNLYIDIPYYQNDKDIYLAITIPNITDKIYALDSTLNFTALPVDNLNDFPAFRKQLISSASNFYGTTLSLFENIPVCSGNTPLIPEGIYVLYTLVVDWQYNRDFKDIDFSKEQYELNTSTFEVKCQ